MRKLKFRAWSEEQNKFIQGYPLGEDQKNGFTVCGISEDGEQETEDDGLVLMQWTGLKDKNGAEVYEGDVLNGCTFNGVHCYGKVEFYNGRFVAFPIGTFKEGLSDFYYILNHIEVIGNIYEHKNLLQ